MIEHTTPRIEAQPQSEPAESKHAVCTVAELLARTNLEIPEYQRPYKWSGKNVRQLFDDIGTFLHKPAYRLGTVVFHRKADKLNIVDGQQRILTLILAVHALIKATKEGKETKLQFKLAELHSSLKDYAFPSEISQQNIRANFLEIYRIVSRPEFTDRHIDFLLNRCEVITFTLHDISEAFQFFDAQNSRGRDLDPHDLLKAFHLREFGNESEEVRARSVERWENSDSEDLANLFGQYLYRIRKWTRGEPAPTFGKAETVVFKGVNLDTIARFPYVESLRIAHHFIEGYNSQLERKIDGRSLAFPFQLDQTIINGRRFFEMAAHYQEMVDSFTISPASLFARNGGEALERGAVEILEAINDYPGMYRTGDRHVRSLFDNLLIYYFDKFGTAELSRAIERIFIWAYHLRLRQSRVSHASVDKYVLERNPFQEVKEATEPHEFFNRSSLPRLSELQSTHTDRIADLFKGRQYLIPAGK